MGANLMRGVGERTMSPAQALVGLDGSGGANRVGVTPPVSGGV